MSSSKKKKNGNKKAIKDDPSTMTIHERIHLMQERIKDAREIGTKPRKNR